MLGALEPDQGRVGTARYTRPMSQVMGGEETVCRLARGEQDPHAVQEKGPAMLSKPFMTTHEIAQLLKVSEPTVRAWIHDQDLRAVKLGREFRVAVKDLEAFVNQRATCAPSWTTPGAQARPNTPLADPNLAKG